MLKDFFPQYGVDLGLYGKNSIVYRYYRRKEKRLYNIASYIGCMSEANREYLINNNQYLDKSKVLIFPNTKKINILKPYNYSYTLRNRYSIPTNSVLFLFGGNMGKPQAMDFLADAIVNLKNEKSVFFALVGRGSEKERIKALLDKNGCRNYLLLDNMHRDLYEEFVRECDVGLILLDYKFTVPNFPSRTLTYMEYSMPVLAATDSVTDLPRMIEKANCGLCCLSNDLNGFISGILRFAEDEQLRKQMGANGRAYITKNYDVQSSVKILQGIRKP